ncbi:MAG: protein kinase, partial [Myxococcota bacterium]
VKLIDFGLAKAVGRSAATDKVSIRGTPAYMAPERLLREHVDHRSDLFACGVVLFELLTGTRLFASRTIDELLHKVCIAELPRMDQHNPNLPEDLQAIVYKALQRDPEQRYQSAAALHDALFEFVQRNGHYVTPPRVARWMQALYSDEYRAESQRLAQLWSRVDRPHRAKTCRGLVSLHDPRGVGPALVLTAAQPDPFDQSTLPYAPLGIFHSAGQDENTSHTPTTSVHIV